jgi:hypothetical protein
MEVGMSTGSFARGVRWRVTLVALAALLAGCGGSRPASRGGVSGADEAGIGCHHVGALAGSSGASQPAVSQPAVSQPAVSQPAVSQPTRYRSGAPVGEASSPAPPGLTGSRAVSAAARRELATYTSSTYTHDLSIDPAAGVYNVDCSGWAGHLIRHANCAAYAELVEFTNNRRQSTFAPRCDVAPGPQPHGPYAEDFAVLVAGIGAGQRSAGGHWTRVVRAVDAVPGDILAYTLPPQAKDTGHVMVVNGTPSVDPGNPTHVVVPIADSTVKAHGTDDSRNGNPRNVGGTGIGSGAVVLVVGADAAPTAGFIWAPGDPYVNTLAAPLVIGRVG